MSNFTLARFIPINYLELLANFTARNLKLKYQGSFLGFLWSLITPLLQMFIYTIVFSYIIRVKVAWPFAVFLLTAQLPWIFFAGSLQMGAGSVIEHGNLIKKVRFPRALLPLSIVLANLIGFGLTLLVLLVFLIGYDIPFTIHILTLFPAILIVFFFTLGLTFITSSLAVFFRDIFHILEVVLLLWFWAVPIVYPISLLEEIKSSPSSEPMVISETSKTNDTPGLQDQQNSRRFKSKLKEQESSSVFLLRTYKLNPMVSMLELFRYAFLYQAWPPLKYLIYASVWSIISLLTGYWFFRKTAPLFAREI